MTESNWMFSLYWLCHKDLGFRPVKRGTLWRVNRTWMDNLLYRSNPHRVMPTNYIPDEEDRRVEIQDIHNGTLTESWASTLLDPTYFTYWRPSDILIEEWSTGIIEFQGPDQLVHWGYEDQGLV